MCMQDTYARCREVCIHLAASTVIPESVAPLFFNRIEGKMDRTASYCRFKSHSYHPPVENFTKCHGHHEFSRFLNSGRTPVARWDNVSRMTPSGE